MALLVDQVKAMVEARDTVKVWVVGTEEIVATLLVDYVKAVAKV